jgi:nicotinate-nucleotide adenylyltransferase
MCGLAVAGEPSLHVCALEIERGGVSYTIDTLMALHASHPNAQLTFVVGADAASTLGSWRDPARLLGLAQLAVAARAGAPRERALDAVAAASAGGGSPARASGVAATRPPTGRVCFLEMPPIEVSSSMVRSRVAAGASIEGLVPPAVACYIAQHDLYRQLVS